MKELAEEIPPDDDFDGRLDEKADWMRHPHTRALLKSAAQARQKALSTLITAARRSTDPQVIVAFAQYEHSRVNCLMLEGKDHRGNDGES